MISEQFIYVALVEKQCRAKAFVDILLDLIQLRIQDLQLTKIFGWRSKLGMGGISIYCTQLINFGVYWIPNIIRTLNRDTQIPILFGITWYELHL